MNGIYKLIVSGIDGNGFQYISGMLEPERLDSNGFRIGKAFSVEIYHTSADTWRRYDGIAMRDCLGSIVTHWMPLPDAPEVDL